MKLVLDASAAFRLLQNDRLDSAIPDSVDFVAPDLIVAELFNARWKLSRAGHRVPSIETITELLVRLRIVSSTTYAANAARLAERIDHPVYDCLYVAAAQHERTKLLTVDTKLTKKLRAHKLSSLLAPT